MKKIAFNCFSTKSSNLVFFGICFILIALLLTNQTLAQNIQSPDKKADMMERGNFKIDPASGALSISIPIRVYAGRGGTSIPINFNYSSKVWQMDYQSYLDNQNCDYGPNFCTTNPITVVFPRFAAESSSGWTSSLGVPQITGGTDLFDSQGRPCGSGSCLSNPHRAGRLYIKMPDGSTHEFRKDDGINIGSNYSETGIYYSVDGTGMRFEKSSSTNELYLPDGSRYTWWAVPVNGIIEWKYIDRNGNTLNWGGNGNLTDSVGRVFNLAGSADPSVEGDVNYTLPGLGETTSTYSLKWRKLEDVRTDPSQPLHYTGDRNHTYNHFSPSLFEADEENRFVVGLHNPVVLSEIVLPGGQTYKFTYNIYGEIDKVVYPTGAYERYMYSNVPTTQPLTFPYYQANRGVTARWISPTGNSADEQFWSYSYPYFYSDNTYKTTQPDGTIIERFFHKGRNFQDPNLKYGFDDARSGKQYEEKVILPGNVIKSRSLTKWEQLGALTYNGVTGHQAATRDPYVSKEISIVFDTGNTNALMQMTEYEHDSNSDPFYFAHLNVKRTKVYDYIVIPKTTAETANIGTLENYFNGQTPLRIQETDYQYTANYKARNLNTLPVESRVKDGAGNIKAKSQISYDESNYLEAVNITNAPGWENPGMSYRGLPTSTRSWYDLTNNQYIETHVSYDQFGNPRKSWDGRGNFTEIQYADNYADNGNRNAHALPTKTISYSGANGTGTVFETSVKYDYNTGLPRYSTDANNQTTEMQYNDPLLRPTKIIAPNGHQTITQYGVPDSSGQLSASQRFVKVRTQIDEQKWTEGYSWFDGLGRTIKTQSVESEGDVFALICYDNMSRVSKTSNPFRNVSNPACSSSLEWTTTTYDAVGRVWKVTTPDNAVVETTYSLATAGDNIGTVVSVKDQANKERRSITNSLGQLARVDEPDVNNSNQLGTISAPYQPTYYEYDLLSNLTKVKQGGQVNNPTQTRTFVYDSLSRLKSANNPESGLIQYTYDNNTNLLTKTDARAITTTYTYDALNRVTFKDYSDSTHDVTYSYDNLPNAKGKLTKVMNGPSSNGIISNPFSITEYQQFDQMGRVTQSQQTTDGAAYPQMTYAYNLSGALIEQKYPSGRVVKNVLDNDGDLSIVQSKKNQTAGYWNYAENFTYTAAGAVSSMQLGNGRWESAQFNSRLQPTQIALGTVQNGTDKLKIDFDYGTLNTGNGQVIAGTNNGNIGKQTITVPTEVRGSTTHNGFTATQYYVYDSLNRIKIANENTTPLNQLTYQSWGQAFDYDRYGNRTFNEAGTTASVNFPKACSGAMCAADKKVFNPQAQTSNNRFSTADGYQYDSAGNTTRDAQSRKFTYDGENKQTKVETVDSTGNVITTLGEYFYDGDGKRVKKYVPGTGETTVFIYDASGKLVAENSTLSAPTQTVSYLTSDSLGTTRIIADANGQVISRRDFQPFGQEILRASYGSDNIRQKFTGYERDNETDLDFAQARYYSKNLGRFTSVDPIKISLERLTDPQRINLYNYARNNPFKYIDDAGEDIELAANLTTAETDRIVNILVNQYMTAAGRQNLERLEQSDIIYRYGTATLGQVTDANGNAVAERFAITIPNVRSYNQNGTFDTNGNLTALNRKGLIIEINFDFNKIDTQNPILPNGQPATQLQIGHHELGHQMDIEIQGPFYQQTTPNSTQETDAEAFRVMMDNQVENGISRTDAEKRIREMLRVPNSPPPIRPSPPPPPIPPCVGKMCMEGAILNN